jgi:uncharacterized protein
MGASSEHVGEFRVNSAEPANYSGDGKAPWTLLSGPPSPRGIDTMMGFPHHDLKAVYQFITAQTRDTESKEESEFPVEYMFKDVPEKGFESTGDPIRATLREMDLWGIEKAMITVGDVSVVGAQAMQRTLTASSLLPQRIPTTGWRALLASFGNMRPTACAPSASFRPGRFPRSRSTTRRCIRFTPSASNSTSLAVKLMLKWPGLHFSTSAFAPKYYPQDIIDYANTPGADKIIYAGYFAMGLSLERIMSEMPQVGFKDGLWPKFLRTNAVRVLGLDG